MQTIRNPEFDKMFLLPMCRGGYCSTVKPMATIILFRNSKGILLGTQALGEDNNGKPNSRWLLPFK